MKFLETLQIVTMKFYPTAPINWDAALEDLTQRIDRAIPELEPWSHIKERTIGQKTVREEECAECA